MKRKSLAGLAAAVMLTLFTIGIEAAPKANDEDTDTRMVSARVVEVAEAHVSVVARTGVEHVIAVDREGTRVTINGTVVSLKDLREGDVVTVELDAHKPVKFARNIELRPEGGQLARVRR